MVRPALSNRSKVETKAGSTPNRFRELLLRVQPELERELKGRLGFELAQLKALGEVPLDTVAAVADLSLRGGKRLRGALVLAGARAVGHAASLRTLVGAGVALELLHTYFLIHDDWMDHDLVRRGGASVHAMLRRRFGNSHRGDAAAILAGDWAATAATRWLTEALGPSHMLAALRVYTALTQTAILGQMRDLVVEDESIELTYYLKTASYTVVGPLQLGATIGGATRSQINLLTSFGTPIGIAFQLRDDLIGMYGDSKRSGKPVGADWRAAKLTFLAQQGFRLAKGTEARFLARTFGNSRTTSTDLKRVAAVLESIGAKESVEKRIEELRVDGLGRLQHGPLPVTGRRLLQDAAVTLIDRKT